MDVKTLSAIVGHESMAVTLDIYTHVTDTMQRDAADSIDRGIAKAEPTKSRKEEAQKPFTSFVPYKGKKRRPGTGYITQINDNLWEGRYSPRWPDGKQQARNIYAHSSEECEEKLAALIVQMKAEIAAAKEAQKSLH